MHKIRVLGTGLVATGATALAAAFPASTAGSAVVISHPARFAVADGADDPARGQAWESSNWSGYAETGHFTSIKGSWTVPAVTPGAADARSAWYSSAWIGIDGFNNENLIQTGTEQDYYDGAAHYGAWWEILPANETVIAENVSAGDAMSATISETSTRTSGRRRDSGEPEWTITLADATKGWTFTTTQVYGGDGSSAELILEAPEVNGSVATLAHYSFPPGSGAAGDFHSAALATTIGGPLSGAGLNYADDAGILVQNGAPVSTPGAPDTAATAFNSNYGATAPAAPTS